MVYHVFPLTAKHLTLDIIEQIVKYIPQQHFFYIVDVVEDKNLYKEYTLFFQKINVTNYLFAKNIEVVYQQKTPKNAPIILHGDNYFWKIKLLLKNYKKLKWVCWGSGNSLPKATKQRLLFPVKKYLYQKLHTIIALSKADQDIFQKTYGCKNVLLNPYISNLNTNNFFTRESITNQSFTKPVVYIGNNTSCLPTYPRVLQNLKTFKNDISKVVCMLNYLLEKNQEYHNLKALGTQIFNENFSIDEKFYSLEQYKDFMHQCNVYICAATEQSGLGAIYTTLRLGKKVYLAANNYQFIKSLGCHIFSVDDLNTKEDFYKDLSFEQKLENFDSIQKHLDLQTLISNWTNIYKP
jgi:hypothetical protein